jgi:hypothetical protein
METMILVHYKIKIGTDPRTCAPVYKEGNQALHGGIRHQLVVASIALMNDVSEEDVIICNVMTSDPRNGMYF